MSFPDFSKVDLDLNTTGAGPARDPWLTPEGLTVETAYGPEANYGSPREVPAGWAVKLRTKATHMGMLGVDLASLMGGDTADDDAPAADAKPKKKRGLLHGIVGGALGVPG